MCLNPTLLHSLHLSLHCRFLSEDFAVLLVAAALALAVVAVPDALAVVVVVVVVAHYQRRAEEVYQAAKKIALTRETVYES